jgi:hypothetical protein
MGGQLFVSYSQLAIVTKYNNAHHAIGHHIYCRLTTMVILLTLEDIFVTCTFGQTGPLA